MATSLSQREMKTALNAWEGLADILGDFKKWMSEKGLSKAGRLKKQSKIQKLLRSLTDAKLNIVFFEWYLESCLEYIRDKVVPRLHEECKAIHKRERSEQEAGSDSPIASGSRDPPEILGDQGEALLDRLRGLDVETYASTLGEVVRMILYTKRFIAEVGSMIVPGVAAASGGSLHVSGQSSRVPVTPGTPATPLAKQLRPPLRERDMGQAGGADLSHRSLLSKFSQRVDALFFASIPKGFEDGMMAYANLSFLHYQKLHKQRRNRGDRGFDTPAPSGKKEEEEEEEEDDDDDEEEDPRVADMSEKELEAQISNFRKMGQNVRDLGWVRFVESAFSRVICARIESRLATTCAGVYDEERLDGILLWMNRTVLNWLQV
ncbi:hypothetical protein AAMO2058_001664100, partial [Amorphochlora amoebiformis]